jgi:hypothetical protein
MLPGRIVNDGSLNVELPAAIRKEFRFIWIEANESDSRLRLLSWRALFLRQSGSPWI